MSREPDRDYYSRRAREEKTLARQAADARARVSHEKLADRYETLAEVGYFPEDRQRAPA